MDELLCDQTKAYPINRARGAELNSITLYQHLKDAIEQVWKTLAADETLITIWHDPSGKPMVVDYVGYNDQTIIVFCGKDDDGARYTALVPIHSTLLVLKKVKSKPGEMRRSIEFIGNSVIPDESGKPSAMQK
jgi:hypothetical protein